MKRSFKFLLTPGLLSVLLFTSCGPRADGNHDRGDNSTYGQDYPGVGTDDDNSGNGTNNDPNGNGNQGTTTNPNGTTGPGTRTDGTTTNPNRTGTTNPNHP